MFNENEINKPRNILKIKETIERKKEKCIHTRTRTRTHMIFIEMCYICYNENEINF